MYIKMEKGAGIKCKMSYWKMKANEYERALIANDTAMLQRLDDERAQDQKRV